MLDKLASFVDRIVFSIARSQGRKTQFSYTKNNKLSAIHFANGVLVCVRFREMGDA